MLDHAIDFVEFGEKDIGGFGESGVWGCDDGDIVLIGLY